MPTPERGALTKFIRQHPDKKPGEIVMLAKAADLKIDVRQIYQVRTVDKNRAARAAANTPRTLEQQFKQLAVRLGYERASRLVESLLTVRAGT